MPPLLFSPSFLLGIVAMNFVEKVSSGFMSLKVQFLSNFNNLPQSFWVFHFLLNLPEKTFNLDYLSWHKIVTVSFSLLPFVLSVTALFSDFIFLSSYMDTIAQITSLLVSSSLSFQYVSVVLVLSLKIALNCEFFAQYGIYPPIHPMCSFFFRSIQVSLRDGIVNVVNVTPAILFLYIFCSFKVQ